MSIKSLIINPGSTSTKIGIFEDETLLFDETLRHSTEEIAQFGSIIEQKDFRKNIILDFLKSKDFDVATLDVCVGRGGMLKPIPGGTYAVNDALVKDLEIGVSGQHASNLGGILAKEIADSIGTPSFIVDPVVVDELADVAIRLADLAGALGVDFTKMQPCRYYRAFGKFSFTENAFALCKGLSKDAIGIEKRIQFGLDYVFNWAHYNGIDLAAYIEAKMRYNIMRPIRHGKKY